MNQFQNEINKLGSGVVDHFFLYFFTLGRTYKRAFEFRSTYQRIYNFGSTDERT